MRSMISDHVRDVHSEFYGLLWSTYVTESRDGVCERGSMVGMCVSSRCLRVGSAQVLSHLFQDPAFMA